MAINAFAKIDGVSGGSTAKGFEDCIEIYEYGQEIEQRSAETKEEGTAIAGPSKHSDFTVSKYIDQSSPALAQKCSDGSPIKQVVVTLTQAGDDKMLMEYKLEECQISKFEPSGSVSGGGLPTEKVSISYGKITWTYMEKKKDGKGGVRTTGMWNVRKADGT